MSPRPTQKPSGMDKGRTDRIAKRTPARTRDLRSGGGTLDRLTITQTIKVKIGAPAGSRRTRYEEIVVQGVRPSGSTVIPGRDARPNRAKLIAGIHPS
jgi:hypothetical protein